MYIHVSHHMPYAAAGPLKPQDPAAKRKSMPITRNQVRKRIGELKLGH